MHIKLSRDCESCALLMELLESERTNNRRLLDKLLALTVAPSETTPVNEATPEIHIKPRTFRERRALLEAEDRKRAQLYKEKQSEIARAEIKLAPEQTVEELEQELGVSDGNIG